MSSSDESITDDTEEFILPKKRKLRVKESRNVPKRDLLASTDGSSSTSWIDQYSPRNTSELCLHPRKLSDLRKVMSSMVNGGANAPKLLILHGPSGCGKSTSAKLLAQDLIASSETSLIEYTESNSFVEFLHDARYRVGYNKCVILVEEYPNVFHEPTHQSFKDSLWEWLHIDEPLPPLILCVTEVEHQSDDNHGREFFNIQNNWTVDTLVGKRISNHTEVAKVKFNPIAMTYIKKALNRLIQSESKSVFNRIPKSETSEFVDSIGKCGDIRSSIANLQFWSTMRSKLPARDEKSMELYSIGKETHLNLFHAVGKIIYGSTNNAYGEVGDDEFDIDYFTILDVLSTYPSNNLLQLSLLENYGIFNNVDFDIEQATKIVDNLSLGDVLGGSSAEGANKEIGIRGVRSILGSVGSHQTMSKGTKGAATSIKFPRHFKIIREYNRITSEIREYQKYVRSGISFQDLNLIYGFYEPKIYNSIKWKTKNGIPNTRSNYNRLGGKFKEIYPTEGLPIADLEEEEEEERLRAVYDQYRIQIKTQMNEGAGMDHETDDGGLSDPIEESDSDFDFDDSIGDMELNNILSQTKSQQVVPPGRSHVAGSDGDSDSDVFSSDEELDELIRKRNL
ncbi:checkpoint protein Rad24p [[Candida] railenensis]|uniref:Checkpoint protein Rad24p n=1 Tax=[Candida] railenensis TaxID=45579 RepID=A0A9P0QRR0_9ASCO|nr:checkpoint protein Rad24p [[Candida] railenensis]